MALTFDEFAIDMAALACERLPSQFEQSVDGIQPFIKAMTNQSQVLNDAEVSVMIGRTVEQAEGVQLDIIGRIVGQPRPLQDGAPILYFQWDSTSPQAWDAESPWWVQNAPLTVLDFVPDIIYRKFIIGKIFRNHIFYCSKPEIMEFIRLTFSVESSIIDTPGEAFCIDVEVEDTIDPLFVPWLSAFRTDSQVQFEYFLPIAAGVRLNSVTLVPLPP
jgi:hypothetical protein